MKTTSTLAKISKSILIIFFIISALLLGQVSQYLQTLKDHQRHEISAWVDNHPEQASKAETFIELCLDSRLTSREESLEESVLKEPMSLYDCGHTVNADQLVQHLKTTNAPWLTFAWPLSAFE
ncbi:hypothetical protein VITU102760_24190 [Vibrio tubiashii]|uniref:Uncharacterized protein n=1 Tax=Vibrio tubiashii ATCC 19109 TaxID=1051646 RepID=F9T582_9VIBR|nr:hypothetical protein [Vibrio tubiashii]AIW17435.1 hypothetical protein IX91_25600 [Vibrio tubiashii ATCC 19109]EGU55279.1 hypothetical protein VITU9109_21074 [Vibrio tubiashii ATCC 19109]EIF04439.1 hypothetical protein VT1337_08731 [Vibrio tubiashii NCIMB 1337 = ATCC 19106]